MLRRILSYLVSVLIAAALVLPVVRMVTFHMLTGHWFPIRRVEALNNPVAVKGWTTEGFRLPDGRLLQLAGVTALPKESAALFESIKHGVEISPDGSVFGLVRIHHWCGNDPVREDLTRVNLGDMLVFLGEATPSVPFEPDPEIERLTKTERFTEHGWNISDFMSFQGWQIMRRLELASQ